MFEKISPQRIRKTIKIHGSYECTRRNGTGCCCIERRSETINFLPEKLDLKPIGKKFHVLIQAAGKKFYSYHFNQMLEQFNYSLDDFQDVKIFDTIRFGKPAPALAFKTFYGSYIVTELLIIE